MTIVLEKGVPQSEQAKRLRAKIKAHLKDAKYEQLVEQKRALDAKLARLAEENRNSSVTVLPNF